MPNERSPQDSGVNWAVVGIGIILLMLANIAIADTFLRVLVSAIIMLFAVFWAQSRPEPEVENPVLDQLHQKRDLGLDRRKYGHLRASTDSLLDHVRQMNKIAVDGREGKLSPRHAQAELDRLAAKMRDLVDDIRKTAGIPTPMEEGAAKDKSPQPQIVIPKPAQPEAGAEPQPPKPAQPRADAAARPPKPEAPPQAQKEVDRSLDQLEAEAEARARKRSEQEGGD